MNAKKQAGYRLCTLMAERDISAEELAKKAGVAPQTVFRFRNGDFSYRCGTPEKIARALGVDVEYLTGEKRKTDTFADRLICLMHDRDMTLDQLEEKTGISVKSLSTYRTGEAVPNIIKFVRIATALDADPLWLLGMKQEEKDD